MRIIEFNCPRGCGDRMYNGDVPRELFTDVIVIEKICDKSGMIVYEFQATCGHCGMGYGWTNNEEVVQ